MMTSRNAAPAETKAEVDIATEEPIRSIPRDVSAWLTQNELGEYAEAFSDNEIDDAVLADGLTDADLRELGVSKLGHRKKILRLISQF